MTTDRDALARLGGPRREHFPALDHLAAASSPLHRDDIAYLEPLIARLMQQLDSGLPVDETLLAALLSGLAELLSQPDLHSGYTLTRHPATGVDLRCNPPPGGRIEPVLARLGSASPSDQAVFVLGRIILPAFVAVGKRLLTAQAGDQRTRFYACDTPTDLAQIAAHGIS
jgi:hypothetical protein